MESELQNVSSEIAENFSNETIQALKTDFLSQKELMKSVYDALITITNASNSKPNTALLRNAYRIIMAARQFFTGEEIIYRIYYATSNTSTSLSKPVGVYNLTEEEILNLTTREGTALRLKASFTKALNNKEHNLEREAIFEKHWGDIYAGLKEVKWIQTTYVVHKSIFQQYIGRNPGLYNFEKHRYMGFNRGNLYEAFDATAEDVYASGYTTTVPSYQGQLFHGKYFGTYLTHDQIKGFQTGDVGLAQIKARHAALMESRTLIIYLKEILDLFDLSNHFSKEELKERIKKLFTNPEMEELDQTLDKTIDKMADKLLDSLKQN